jgi:hypothetical protein
MKSLLDGLSSESNTEIQEMCFIAVELLQANWNCWPTLTEEGKMEEFKIKVGGSRCSMHGKVFLFVPSVLITSTWF